MSSTWSTCESMRTVKRCAPAAFSQVPWPLTVVGQLEEKAAGKLLALEVIVRHRPSEHLQA